MKKFKKPEIIMITAMDENGLIGNGNSLPWKSSLDFKWFQQQTMGWPCIFGTNTAYNMPQFPLRNRICAVVSNKTDHEIRPTVFERGAHLAFGPGGFYDALAEALRFFKNYDKIFIAGGATLYKHALQKDVQVFWELSKSMGDKAPLVDTIIKTTVPAGHVQGDKYLDAETIKLMSAPNFELAEFLTFKLDSKDQKTYNQSGWKLGTDIKTGIAGNMPTEHQIKETDTPFPWINFEVLRRVKENPGM